MCANDVRPTGRSRGRARVPPDARKRQLLTEAAQLLTEYGVERVQITEVAERAGVSRPLVYRLFPTRQALVRAILTDLADFLNEQFVVAQSRFDATSVEALATAFVEASCEAIAQKGAGPWLLLDPRGPDPEINRLGRAIFEELLDPWQQQLGSFLGVSPERAAHLLWIIVAAGRAALVGWIEGAVSREQAGRDATRVITTLLAAFTSDALRPSPAQT